MKEVSPQEEPNRPSTPVFDSKLDGNSKSDTPEAEAQNEDDNFIFEQIKSDVQQLDSDQDEWKRRLTLI